MVSDGGQKGEHGSLQQTVKRLPRVKALLMGAPCDPFGQRVTWVISHEKAPAPVHQFLAC